ncbi:MAG: heparan-alpha-glucosaminide N-acetyltransferase domain-containing protein [Nocardioidaceae bacterium]
MSVVAPNVSHRPGAGPLPPLPADHPRGSGSPRVVGIDVARGLALLGMLAVHIFDVLHADDTPSKTFQVMGGHAVATFVLLAGVSLTFITTRPRTGSRRTDASTAASLAGRALVITAIGLALNSALDPDIDVILPYYGLMFLLVIPLLGLRSRSLLGVSLALVVLAPLLVLATFATSLPNDEPTLSTLIHPVDLLVPLLLTGTSPAVAYLAFICAGMVIGRLDLSSARVAGRLTVVGVVLSAGSWLVSTALLLRFGGLEHLRSAAPADVSARAARDIILWDPDTVSSWWWLVERAPYATTPFRMLHDLGIAMAWLGVALLVTRSRTLRRALGPVAAAGAMTLTLYTAHVVVLSTSFLEDDQIPLFAVLTYVALSSAALWRRDGRKGPLEAAVTWTANRARDLTATRLPGGSPDRLRARRRG